MKTAALALALAMGAQVPHPLPALPRAAFELPQPEDRSGDQKDRELDLKERELDQKEEAIDRANTLLWVAVGTALATTLGVVIWRLARD